MGQDKRPSRTRRKHCRCCHELFEPDSRTKNRQRYCSKPECQDKRQRLNETHWRERNPDCLAMQREQSRDWHKAHPEYSRERRLDNPLLVQANRNQTRIRMRKTRALKLFDKSKSILTQLIEGKADKCCLTKGSRWLMVRLTKASPLSKLWHPGDNHIRLKRAHTRLPRSRLYDVSGIF
jgi:hypothetical protein